ncbi:arginine/serine-rich protein PNISR [Toxorhynchites rutilus septentrionalis]|uniref:arginine/serine-rich protein PNISR n=1 Tax=Toxorhynchites rutilus septentrionalis TaxID=329112 RepID=UPI0024789790|nr:arginine/serine-rich protein PNISR [Toxorhynchites rutilus septentrionalis]
MYGRPGSGRGQNGAHCPSGGASNSMMVAITPTGVGLVPPMKNYQTTASAPPVGAMLEGEWSSLNPNLYQNMSNDQVDWAALAQQWIQMKETLPADMVPPAPPPPIISDHYASNSRESSSDGMRLGTIDEQGEAPMEVEKEEEQTSMGHQQQQSSIWNNEAVPWQFPNHSEWRNPAWDTNWSSGQSNKSTISTNETESVTSSVNPNASIAVANWQAKMARIYKLGESNHTETIVGTVQPTSQKPAQHHDVSKRIPGLMDQVIKLDREPVEQSEQCEDTTETINDAKRKLLPAWIREGLEKMEREKLRQVEKEKEQRLREEMLEQRRQAELEVLSEIENAKKKSKFDSDSEDEEDVNEGENVDNVMIKREPSPVQTRSREEIMQELMIAVRKNLTDILLEVTNEEIASVAKETLAKTKRKAPTAQALRKTGLATLTGGLGLGIYEDSDDEDNSASDNDRNDEVNSENEEETERLLRNAVKQRQKEFEWTAREIEDQLAQEEAREERKRREYEQSTRQKLHQQQDSQQQKHDSEDEDEFSAGNSRAGLGHSQTSVGNLHGGKFGPRDGETQPVNDNIYAYKLGKTRDKRISRFSDPKDTVRQTHITHVAIVNHRPGEIVQPVSMPRMAQSANQMPPGSSGVSPPVVSPTATPLFPAAIAAAMHLENYRRGNSVSSETPSTASSRRASSSHRSSRERNSSSKSSHRLHKSKKHKRSRHSRSDDENYDYAGEQDDERYSHHSRRSRSSERSAGYSRRRRSYSRDSRDDDRDRKYSYRSRDRSRSRSRDRHKSSKRIRSRSRSSSKRRY